MKQLFYSAIFLFLANYLHAQNVGINVADPRTALEISGQLSMTPYGVDVTSNVTSLPTDRGYVKYTGTPGVDFTLPTPLPISGSFLIIENTTPNLLTITGVTTVPSTKLVVLFYGDTGWRVINDSQNNWSLTGNSGTNSTTDFIGVTDDKDIYFRRNNIKSGQLDKKGNTGFGQGTLLDILPASVNNTAIGRNALSNLEVGNENTAVGNNAMEKFTSGERNIAIGDHALQNGDNISKTIAIGFGALQNTNNKDGNTAIGTLALSKNAFTNTTPILPSQGNGNTAIGSTALSENRRGSNAVAIGNNAARNDTMANGIIAIGNGALFHNRNGRNNFAVGDSSLYNTGFGTINSSQASSNIGIGKNSLLFNVSGSQNMAIGLNALKASKFNDYNTGIGNDALSHLTTGTKNTAVISWHNLQSGSYNVGLGRLSFAIPKGNKNTMIGEANIFAQSLTDSISENVLIGYRSGLSITGHKNVLLGNNAGGLNINGKSNTALGDSSIVKNQLGNNNVSIGAKSGANLISGSGNVFLGYQAGAPELGSNKLYIENTNANKNNSLIYGDFLADSLLLNSKTVIRDNAVVRGYTKLGGYETSVPSIKMKKITNTGPLFNASKNIAHGLNAAKILEVEIFMEWEFEGFPASPTRVVPPNFTKIPGLHYQYEILDNDIIIYNINSIDIVGRNLRILITYEE